METKQERAYRLLLRYRIPIWEEWGRGKAKTIRHLLDEIENGECELVERRSRYFPFRKQLVRVLRVLVIRISRNDGYVLVETERYFNDGRDITRPLDASLAEKMFPHERARSAAVRALQEELQIFLHADEYPLLLPGGETRGFASSTHFPGLLTDRRVQIVNFKMPQKYVHDEYREVQKDKTTVFGWIPWSERPWKSKKENRR